MRLALILLLAVPAFAATDIQRADGGVSVLLGGLGRWIPVSRLPYGLRPGDRVRLKPASRALLELDDGTSFAVSRDAALSLERDDEGQMSVFLQSGLIEARVRRYHDRIIEVRTPRGRITLRGDRATIRMDRNGTAVVEVSDGLAEVSPTVGPAVQVPDGYRLELPPGKPAGDPVPQREFRRLQRRWKPAPDGMNRHLERRRPSADPDPESMGPSGTPALGPEALGLPDDSPAAPALGPKAVGVDPSLGPDSLGLKERRSAPVREPELGPESLGLKTPR